MLQGSLMWSVRSAVALDLAGALSGFVVWRFIISFMRMSKTAEVPVHAFHPSVVPFHAHGLAFREAAQADNSVIGNNDHFNASTKIGVQIGWAIGDKRVCAQLNIQQLLDVGFMKKVMGLINDNPMRQTRGSPEGSQHREECL